MVYKSQKRLEKAKVIVLKPFHPGYNDHSGVLVNKKPDIKWNFTKFIIDRNGCVVARFEPTADMADVEACIKALL